MGTGTPSAQDPAAPIRFRRNADRLTPGQLELLRDASRAVYAISDDRGYAHHAGIHGLPLPISCENAHGTPFFLPWHRAYLYFFERALRDRVRDAMLAWWDWRTGPERPPRLPDSYAHRTAGGRQNPLFSAEISSAAIADGRRQGRRPGRRTRRHPGLSERLPSALEVTDVLELRDFQDFSFALENLHNRVHVWVGGHMGDIAFAAFDPVFWAHHTMCDRLWRIWQLRHPGGRPPASILDEALPPFRMTVRQTLDVTELGYDYAVGSASAEVSGRR